MADKYKQEAVAVAKDLSALGFGIVSTRGTAATMRAEGVNCEEVFKISEGRPNPAGAYVVYTCAHSLSRLISFFYQFVLLTSHAQHNGVA